jgi:hypothetical protein
MDLKANIIIPTTNQQCVLWKLADLYSELLHLVSIMSSRPTKCLQECEQFTKNVKSILPIKR